MEIRESQSGFNCTVISGGAIFNYGATRFSTGDAYVHCLISGSVIQVSDSAIYKSSQTGASTLACFLTWDIDASTGGYWEFTGTSGTRQIQYKDTGSASDGTVITFTSGDCTVY